MSQDNSQLNQGEQAYFYALIKEPNTPAPDELDPATAALIRRLVAEYRERNTVPLPELNAAKARVWQQIQAQKQTSGELVLTADRPGAPEQPTGAEQWQALDPDKSVKRKPASARQKMVQWGRWTTIAGLAASVAVIVGLLIIVAVINGANEPNDGNRGGANTATVQPTTTTQPIGYSVTLQANLPAKDSKTLETSRAIIEQRLIAAGLTNSKAELSDQQNIVVTVKGSTDRANLLRLLGTGRLEIIQTDGMKLTEGQLVCTSTALKLSQCDPSAKPGGMRDSDGQPFKTLISSDMLQKSGLVNGNQASMAKIFGGLAGSSDELKKAYAAQTLAIVLDGQALTAIPLNQLLEDYSGNNSSLLNTSESQAEISLLTIILKYGQLPLDLKVVNLQAIY